MEAGVIGMVFLFWCLDNGGLLETSYRGMIQSGSLNFSFWVDGPACIAVRMIVIVKKYPFALCLVYAPLWRVHSLLTEHPSIAMCNFCEL